MKHFCYIFLNLFRNWFCLLFFYFVGVSKMVNSSLQRYSEAAEFLRPKFYLIQIKLV